MAHPNSASESFRDSSSSETVHSPSDEGLALASLLDLLAGAEASSTDPQHQPDTASRQEPDLSTPHAEPASDPAMFAPLPGVESRMAIEENPQAEADQALTSEVLTHHDVLNRSNSETVHHDVPEPEPTQSTAQSTAQVSTSTDASNGHLRLNHEPSHKRSSHHDAHGHDSSASFGMSHETEGQDREASMIETAAIEFPVAESPVIEPSAPLDATMTESTSPTAASDAHPLSPSSRTSGEPKNKSRIKLSPRTLRERTSVGEFVEPVEPKQHPEPTIKPKAQTPSSSKLSKFKPATPAKSPATPPVSATRRPPPPSHSHGANHGANHAIVPASESRLTELESRLIELESQLDFGEITEAKDRQIKLMPLVDEILSSLTPTALRQETIRSIIPVIDRIIIERSEQNRDAMSAAISDLMPQAIARQVEADPHAIAEAVAPEMAEALRRQIAIKKGVLAEAISSEMGEAIRRQIVLEREEMVDALYPVIGNTITKYMSEEIRNINAKVEQSFSLEGMTRKLRAKLQGVSEAELILRDSSSFTVKAAFLIHKESGLVIAEAQQPNASPLESDMIGGMLTAIRSFANDCIAQADAGNTAELNEIEYDTFKLVLEVAGYCYVALVVKGSITKAYVNHMRLVMVGLVQDYGSRIKDFDGDPSTIPDDVSIKVASLVPDPIEMSQQQAQASKHPPALLILLVLGILGGAILWARQAWQHRVEETVLRKIDVVPELTAYRIEVEAKGGQLELSGDLPSRSLQEKLIEVVTPIVPDREVIDRTQLAVFEPDDATIAAEVDRLTSLLNRTLPATVVTQYQDRRVILKGWAEDEAVLAAIGTAFESVPGVKSVSSALLIDAPPDKIRLYFELGQTNPIAIGKRKLESVERFLEQFPNLRLNVIGHADRIGTTEQNQTLAQARANQIRQLLIDRGVAADRLTISSSLDLPPGINPQQPLELSRCVRFEILDRDPTETIP